MALKKLTAAEMVSITGPWVDKHHAEHEALASVPEVRALLPRLEAAHKELLDVSAPAAPSIDESEAQRKLRKLDERHDNIARGVFYVLLGSAFLAKKPSLSSGLLALQEFLLPEGIKITQKSYREESGHGALIENALTADQRAQLKAVPVPGGTLLDAVEEWLDVSRKLGAIEDERQERAAEATGATPQVQLAARNKWIRVVNAITSLLELAEVDDAKLRKLLARVRDAERRADRRSATEGNAPASDSGAGGADGSKTG